MTDKEQRKDSEIYEGAKQLIHEVELLEDAAAKRGYELDKEYADEVMRSELIQIAEIVEMMSERVGAGEATSITDPSDLNGDD